MVGKGGVTQETGEQAQPPHSRARHTRSCATWLGRAMLVITLKAGCAIVSRHVEAIDTRCALFPARGAGQGRKAKATHTHTLQVSH